MASFPFDELWNYYLTVTSLNKHSIKYYGDKEARYHMESLFQAASTLYSSFYPQQIVEFKNFSPTKTDFFFIGDIHGSFSSLHRMISFFVKKIEAASSQQRHIKIIFLGDYVDRNPLDLHTLVFLLLFNLKYPKNVLLLRGNHEEKTMNKQYGFRYSVLRQFPRSLFIQISEFFTKLPLAAIFSVPNSFSIIALHGGVPINLEDPLNPVLLRKIELKAAKSSILNMDELSQQILWNDPSETLPKSVEFCPNRYRGGTFFEFNKQIFDIFMEANNFDLMIRGHQQFSTGYRFFFEQRLVSLFSTEKYVGNRIDGCIAQVNFPNKNDNEAIVKLLHIRDFRNLSKILSKK
ncbi:MAG: serine/threonine protein phosphatase [Candidatus Lokiarchaeota archaeon]|nr:serine/threonine protein phosphatase [Candidatus Harpocratesius repetitus]